MLIFTYKHHIHIIVPFFCRKNILEENKKLKNEAYDFEIFIQSGNLKRKFRILQGVVKSGRLPLENLSLFLFRNNKFTSIADKAGKQA